MKKFLILWVALVTAWCASCTEDDNEKDPSGDNGKKGVLTLIVKDHSVRYLTIHTFQINDSVTVNWGDGAEERFKALKAYDLYDQEINGYWVKELEHSYEDENPHTITITGRIKGLTYDSYGLAHIDASQCPGLEEIDCCDSELVSLELTNCKALKKLYCEDNNLQSLDLSGCPVLKELNCAGNKLEALDLSGCPVLKKADCHDNLLATLNTTGCTALKELDCAHNLLTALNLTGNTALETLDCRNNRLTALDITRCTKLKTLLYQGNNITSLDISQCPDLEGFRGILQGDWSRSFDFAGLPRVGAVSFTMTVDGKEYAFVGLGRNDLKINDSDKTLRDFWRFDGRKWVLQDSFPAEAQGRYGAVAFVIDGKAYVGTGMHPAVGPNDKNRYCNDFYVFDPKAEQGSQWSKVTHSFPGEGRYGAIAFSLNGKGYVGTGFTDGSRALKDMYEYDPATGWKESSFNGNTRGGAVAFVVGNKAVVCLGVSSATSGTYCEDVCIFDGQVWTVSPNPLHDLSGRNWDNGYDRIPRAYAVAFTSSLDEGIEKGYIATGFGNYANTCWSYDIERDRWEEVTELPNLMSTRAYAVGFTLGNRGYVTLGGSALTSVGDALTWKFTPAVLQDDDNDYAPADWQY